MCSDKFFLKHAALLIDLCRPVSGSRSSCALRTSERGLLSVPFARATISCRAALVLLWTRRYGVASLLRDAQYLVHFQKHGIINLKLFILTVLGSGAPLSSSLKRCYINL